MDILELAEHHKLPIIADEVYEFFTFPGVQFFPLSALSKNVPILCKIFNELKIKNYFQSLASHFDHALLYKTGKIKNNVFHILNLQHVRG